MTEHEKNEFYRSIGFTPPNDKQKDFMDIFNEVVKNKQEEK